MKLAHQTFAEHHLENFMVSAFEHLRPPRHEATEDVEINEWLGVASDLIRLQGHERASKILSEVLSFAAQKGVAFDLPTDVLDYLVLTNGMTDQEIDVAEKQISRLVAELTDKTARADKHLNGALASLARAGVL